MFWYSSSREDRYSGNTLRNVPDFCSLSTLGFLEVNDVLLLHLSTLSIWYSTTTADKHNSISSGFPYPLPILLIPANIYLIFRLILSLLLSRALGNKNEYLKKHNHKAAPPFSSVADDPLVPWLFPSLPEIDLPITFIPPNVTPCGPIIMDFPAVEDIDVDLAQWLSLRPTVVVNLGSLFQYDERSASSMLGAIELLLEEVAGVQVLWKMTALQDGEAGVTEMRKRLQGERRVRVEQWISANMGAVLAHETVIAAVHHGGASSYHEAIRFVTTFALPHLPPSERYPVLHSVLVLFRIAISCIKSSLTPPHSAGIPQILLPMWVDLYDFTTRVEYLGIGLWGSRKSAPGWDARELGDAMVKVVQDSEISRAMRRKAEELSRICRKQEGRKVAAKKIIEML
jgi:UDP:flavonoid glycosyltransferase YjiC (YdhE family)